MSVCVRVCVRCLLARLLYRGRLFSEHARAILLLKAIIMTDFRAMDEQATRRLESHVAQIALKRPFASMRSKMIIQSRLTRKRSFA